MVDAILPFENKFEALVKAKLGKMLMCQPLADSMRRRVYTVHIDGCMYGPWEPGFRGAIACWPCCVSHHVTQWY